MEENIMIPEEKDFLISKLETIIETIKNTDNEYLKINFEMRNQSVVEIPFYVNPVTKSASLYKQWISLGCKFHNILVLVSKTHLPFVECITAYDKEEMINGFQVFLSMVKRTDGVYSLLEQYDQTDLKLRWQLQFFKFPKNLDLTQSLTSIPSGYATKVDEAEQQAFSGIWNDIKK